MPVICNFESCSGDILKVSYDPWRKPWPSNEILHYDMSARALVLIL